MAKRQTNRETKSLDKKFEIDTETFVVVSNFNLMVILQQKRGLHVHQPIPAAIRSVSEEDKGILNLRQMRIRRTKCAIMVEQQDKGSSIQLRTIAIRNLLSR